jgi:hypothetical protein
LDIAFFNDIVFTTPQLVQFICRTPRLKALKVARVVFDGSEAEVKLSPLTSGDNSLSVRILCGVLNWQVSSVEQVFTSSSPPLPTLEDLYIFGKLPSRAQWQGNVENVQWLELLHPFRAVKNLYLSEEFALRIVPALQELVGSREMEVLPTLQNVFLEKLEPSGPVQEGIRQFAATRQVTSDSTAVSLWDREPNIQV